MKPSPGLSSGGSRDRISLDCCGDWATLRSRQPRKYVTEYMKRPTKQQLLAEMGKFNEELVKAGVLLAAEGLQPTSKGKRVRFSGEKRTVIDGPFTESKELIAGFWLWQVRSMEEAVEWVKRCPNPFEGESEIEIRQVFEVDDFGSDLTPELRKREERMREQVARKK